MNKATLVLASTLACDVILKRVGLGGPSFTMRVALDTNALYTTRAGAARYVRGLQNGFNEIETSEVTISPLAWPVANFEYAQPQRLLKTAWRELIWARGPAKRRLRTMDTDLLHSTALSLIPHPPCREVVTLHDLALMRQPERFRPWQRRSGLALLKRVAQADHVIAVSQFTADEAMTLLELPAKKVTVVPHGVTLAQQESLPSDIPAEFFLFVGSLEPGKNLELLRQIWLVGEESGKRLPSLIIVGSRWEGVAAEGTAPADWHFLGYQDDEVLLALYRRAQALLFPSFYEGFGLPVLEAMSAGCPVICGSVASLPEVGGDAVRYAELNVAKFSAAIHELLSDDETRRALREAGRMRAERFNWKTCAQETLAVYRSTLK